MHCLKLEQIFRRHDLSLVVLADVSRWFTMLAGYTVGPYTHTHTR